MKQKVDLNDDVKIKAGVVGWPIGHSLSPRLHTYWLKKHDISASYEAFAIRPEDLGDFLKNAQQQNIIGLNLTVPHKEIAFPYLAHVDDLAQKIGAVNTVMIKDGEYSGTNTDAYGFLANLKENAPAWTAKNGPVVIIGAGGAGRAAIVSLLDDGVDHICLINRTKTRAEKLVAELSNYYPAKKLFVADWENRSDVLSGAALLVNTTTLGMKGQRELDISLGKLPEKAVVYDIVYNPLETLLLAQAKMRGNAVVDGLGMLLYQAAPAFEKWFGQKVEVDQNLRDHVLEGLRQ